MNTLSSLVHCPCEITLIERLASRAAWIRLNRLLAWAVVVSPFVQIALRTNLVNGLLFDLALLVAHGFLSVRMFGLPRTVSGERWMLWLGVAPDNLSARGRFLMTAWRIALGLLWIPAVYVLGMTFGPLTLVVLPLCLPLWLLQPVFALGHVFGASGYAFRRWGLGAQSDFVPAFFLTGMFAFASVANLVR